MTETEAKYFKKRFLELCAETERDCGCKIEVCFSERCKSSKGPSFMTGDFSLKIDSPK